MPDFFLVAIDGLLLVNSSLSSLIVKLLVGLTSSSWTHSGRVLIDSWREHLLLWLWMHQSWRYSSSWTSRQRSRPWYIKEVKLVSITSIHVFGSIHTLISICGSDRIQLMGNTFIVVVIVSFQEALALILCELFASLAHELLVLHLLVVVILLGELLVTILFALMDKLFLFSQEVVLSLSWKRLSLILWSFGLHSILFIIDCCLNVDSWTECALFHLLCKNSLLMKSGKFSSLSLLLILVAVESFTNLLWFVVDTDSIWMLFNVIPVCVWNLISILWSSSKLVINLLLPCSIVSLLVSRIASSIVNILLNNLCIVVSWRTLETPIFVLSQISCILIHFIIIIIILSFIPIIIIVILSFIGEIFRSLSNIAAALINVFYSHRYNRYLGFFLVTLAHKIWCEGRWSLGILLVIIHSDMIIISLYLLLLTWMSHLWWRHSIPLIG